MIFIFIRLITFFASINIIFPAGTPNMFKVAFSLFISVIISFGVDIHVDVVNELDLINIVVMETITGLVLGYITTVCFSTLKIAGSLIDQQLGLSMLSIYDPNTKDQSTLMENIMYWMGIMIFFGMNGHHELINGIKESFYLVEIGESILSNNLNYVVEIFIQYFAIGFRIAVPIILSLIITDLIMGLISRSVPQLNVMIIGMPLKILIGIVFFTIAMPFILIEMHNLFNDMPSILDGTIGLNDNILSSFTPLGFMLSTDGDKTEEPTAKKKKDARKQGNVAKSSEVTTAITLLAMLLIAYTMSDYIILELRNFIITYLDSGFNVEMTMGNMQGLVVDLLSSFMMIFLPIAIIIIVFGIIGNLIQTGLMFTGEGLKPKLSKLNPISGFKNMFSLKALGNLVKSILIICILFYIGYSFMEENFVGIIKSGYIYMPYLTDTITDLIKKLLSNIALAVVVIAAIDYIYKNTFIIKN